MSEGYLVVNTGPLVALATVERLDILPVLFETIAIPEDVHREIQKGGAVGLGLPAYEHASWLRVEPLSDTVDPLLTSMLDKGEAAVIQLARERRASCVLIDERKARRIARAIYNLRVIGTVGTLVEAKKRGIVEQIGPLLATMRQNGYWIHDSIIDFALAEAGESERSDGPG